VVLDFRGILPDFFGELQRCDFRRFSLNEKLKDCPPLHQFISAYKIVSGCGICQKEANKLQQLKAIPSGANASVAHSVPQCVLSFRTCNFYAQN
jgi:hypothetical protein